MFTSKGLLSWFPPLVFTLCLFLTLSPVRNFWDFVSAYFSLSSIRNFTEILLAIFFLAAALYFFFAIKKGKTRRLLWLFAAALGYSFIFYSNENTIEIAHIAEYGVLTWLYCLPLKKSIKDKTIFPVLWLIGLSVGICDELIQFYLPTRVGDLPDIYLNAASSGLATILFAKVLYPCHAEGPVSLKNVRITCSISIFLLILSGVSISIITDWGFCHEDPQIGVFYSRFPLKDLKEKDLKEAKKYSKAIKELYPSNLMDFLKNQSSFDKFQMEALIHLLQRDRYESRKEYWMAYKENQILDRYFTETIVGSGYNWSEEKVFQVKEKIQGTRKEFYESPVSKNEIIVSFGPKRMWGGIIFLICGLLLIILKRRETSVPYC